MLSASDIQG